MVAETMKSINEKLPENQFMRVHKSYIVSLAKIDQIEGNQIRLKDEVVPIGNKYRLLFEQRFKK